MMENIERMEASIHKTRQMILMARGTDRLTDDQRQRLYSLERDLQESLIQALEQQTEMPLSSPAMTLPVDAQNGENTSSEMYYLVRAGQNGELQTMATVTLPALSSTQTPGSVLKDLLDDPWTHLVPSTWAWRLASGVMPSQTQEAQEVGLSVGAPEAGSI